MDPLHSLLPLRAEIPLRFALPPFVKGGIEGGFVRAKTPELFMLLETLRILRSPPTPDAHPAHDQAARASPAQCRARAPDSPPTAPTRPVPVGDSAPVASPETVLPPAYRGTSAPAQLLLVSGGRSQTTRVQTARGVRPARALP